MEIIIKKFEELTLEELYEILRCRTEVFALEQGIAYQDLDGKDQHSIHVFMRENDEIISYLRVIKPGIKYDYASIGRVLTKNKARHQGYAKTLMLKGIEIASAMSPIIEIEAQSYLEKFYQNLGFKTCSEEFILEGIPHISMRL